MIVADIYLLILHYRLQLTFFIFVGILHLAEPGQARTVLLLSVPLYFVHRGQETHSNQGNHHDAPPSLDITSHF